MTAINLVLMVVGLFPGIGGIGACVWCVVRVKGFDITVQLNGELRQGLIDERELRMRDQERFSKEISDDRVECARAIGVLQGQVAALTDGLAEKLLTAVMTAIHNPERRRDDQGGPQ